MTIQSALLISTGPGKYARYGTSSVLLGVEGKTRKHSAAEVTTAYHLVRVRDAYALNVTAQQDSFGLHLVMSQKWTMIEKTLDARH